MARRRKKLISDCSYTYESKSKDSKGKISQFKRDYKPLIDYFSEFCKDPDLIKEVIEFSEKDMPEQYLQLLKDNWVKRFGTSSWDENSRFADISEVQGRLARSLQTCLSSGRSYCQSKIHVYLGVNEKKGWFSLGIVPEVSAHIVIHEYNHAISTCRHYFYTGGQTSFHCFEFKKALLLLDLRADLITQSEFDSLLEVLQGRAYKQPYAYEMKYLIPKIRKGSKGLKESRLMDLIVRSQTTVEPKKKRPRSLKLTLTKARSLLKRKLEELAHVKVNWNTPYNYINNFYIIVAKDESVLDVPPILREVQLAPIKQLFSLNLEDFSNLMAYYEMSTIEEKNPNFLFGPNVDSEKSLFGFCRITTYVEIFNFLLGVNVPESMVESVFMYIEKYVDEYLSEIGLKLDIFKEEQRQITEPDDDERLKFTKKTADLVSQKLLNGCPVDILGFYAGHNWETLDRVYDEDPWNTFNEIRFTADSSFLYAYPKYFKKRERVYEDYYAQESKSELKISSVKDVKKDSLSKIETSVQDLVTNYFQNEGKIYPIYLYQSDNRLNKELLSKAIRAYQLNSLTSMKDPSNLKTSDFNLTSPKSFEDLERVYNTDKSINFDFKIVEVIQGLDWLEDTKWEERLEEILDLRKQIDSKTLEKAIEMSLGFFWTAKDNLNDTDARELYTANTYARASKVANITRKPKIVIRAKELYNVVIPDSFKYLLEEYNEKAESLYYELKEAYKKEKERSGGLNPFIDFGVINYDMQYLALNYSDWAMGYPHAKEKRMFGMYGLAGEIPILYDASFYFKALRFYGPHRNTENLLGDYKFDDMEGFRNLMLSHIDKNRYLSLYKEHGYYDGNHVYEDFDKVTYRNIIEASDFIDSSPYTKLVNFKNSQEDIVNIIKKFKVLREKLSETELRGPLILQEEKVRVDPDLFTVFENPTLGLYRSESPIDYKEIAKNIKKGIPFLNLVTVPESEEGLENTCLFFYNGFDFVIIPSTELDIVGSISFEDLIQQVEKAKEDRMISFEDKSSRSNFAESSILDFVEDQETLELLTSNVATFGSSQIWNLLEVDGEQYESNPYFMTELEESSVPLMNLAKAGKPFLSAVITEEGHQYCYSNGNFITVVNPVVAWWLLYL